MYKIIDAKTGTTVFENRNLTFVINKLAEWVCEDLAAGEKSQERNLTSHFGMYNGFCFTEIDYQVVDVDNIVYDIEVLNPEEATIKLVSQGCFRIRDMSLDNITTILKTVTSDGEFAWLTSELKGKNDFRTLMNIGKSLGVFKDERHDRGKVNINICM